MGENHNYVATPQGRMLLGSETDATVTALSVPDATLTEPASVEASGVIVVPAPRLRNLMNFLFFGTDAENEMLNVAIYRWYRKFAADGVSDYWIPQIVCSIVDLTLGTCKGVAGQIPSEVHFIADSMVSIEVDSANRQTSVTAPANAQFGLVLDTFGCQKIEVQFAGGTTPAAKGNFLYIGD